MTTETSAIKFIMFGPVLPKIIATCTQPAFAKRGMKFSLLIKVLVTMAAVFSFYVTLLSGLQQTIRASALAVFFIEILVFHRCKRCLTVFPRNDSVCQIYIRSSAMRTEIATKLFVSVYTKTANNAFVYRKVTLPRLSEIISQSFLQRGCSRGHYGQIFSKPIFLIGTRPHRHFGCNRRCNRCMFIIRARR